MKRPQNSTHMGTLSAGYGILALYQDVLIKDIFDFSNYGSLTIGALVKGLFPFVIALIGWMHDEKGKKKKKNEEG